MLEKLISRTILEIYYRCYLEYLKTKKVTELGLWFKKFIRRPKERHRGVKSYSNLLSILGAKKVALDGPDRAIELFSI